jgi:hypothetical protein
MTSIKTLALGALLVGHSYAQTPASSASAPPPPSSNAASLPRAENTIHVAGNAPRPLDQAIQELRLKYGWTIDYEDPPYLYGKDVIEAKGSLWPAGNPFSVEIPSAPSPAGAPVEDKSLQLIVGAYNSSGNPGQFELRKSESGTFTIVGVAVRNDKGVVSPQKPLLDSTITVPAQERSISDTVDVICKMLTDETHFPVSVGVTPRSLVNHTNATIGGTKVPARTLLTQALAAASGHTLYWQLLFDPSSKSYLLNIHALHPAKQPPPETPGKPPSSGTHP